jgi:hypothetical protein
MVKLSQSLQIMTIQQFVQYKLLIKFFLELKDLAKQMTNRWQFFVNNQGQHKYLTGSKISELLQPLAKTTHPDMTPDEISCISSYSGRVRAVVLLNKAGKSLDFIKS